MPGTLPPLNLALSEADNSRTAFGSVGTGNKVINFPASKRDSLLMMGLLAALVIGGGYWLLKGGK